MNTVGDREALELSRKITNFILLPKTWGGLAEILDILGDVGTTVVFRGVILVALLKMECC